VPGLSVSVQPLVEPITAAEIKTHLRVSGNDEDAYIRDLIVAGRVWVENYTGRALINRTLVLTLNSFPDYGHPIWLPDPPLSSVSSIQYSDTTGTTQTLSASKYITDTSTDDRATGVYEAYNCDWPTTYDQVNAVTVTYVAGYGAAASAVPEAFKHGLKMLVGSMFCERVPCDSCDALAQNSPAAMLLSAYRVQNDLVGLARW
jgi:uncharacterized phiE125 gp8 family phage protein